MGIVLGQNQYGKAENRVVRIYRDSARHVIRDLNVSTALRGDFSAAYTTGDQAHVLPTDTQKNTAYAYAKKVGIEQIEHYALALGRHFVDDTGPVEGARIEVDEYAWERIIVGGQPHDHSFVRKGQEIRTTTVTIDGKGQDQSAHVVSGLRDLVMLKSTGSEFAGFLTDDYTTLPETHDRVMATSLHVRWRYTTTDHDWGAAYDEIRQTLVEQFASVHSLALQQTLFEMGTGVLEAQSEVAEVKLSAPNIHHFAYDLQRFGLDNDNEVFHVDDRPYGLIQATVQRDDAPDAGRAWETSWSF
ncbi:MAG: urate oxidase [Nocardioidaceae bacterium]|nr:urate oxidase [Nocardioidaceae bacterium]